jgi:inosine-uridine nucleoside N-ribohydrolase
MTQKIIIDTDPGHDDAMALMLACGSPEFDILAVTTVSGNSTIQNTTRNARFILNFIDKSSIPIYSGAEKPLRRDLVQAVVHGASGLDGVDPTNESNLTGDAVTQLLRLIKANPNEVTIIALGPLTNIALAIEKDPATMKLAKQIVAMGGAINVAGNKNRVAEFNIFVDPDAADIVMRFPVPKTLVPLDACNHVALQLEDIPRVKSPLLRSLFTNMLTPYIANLQKDVGTKGALMYDPLTVFYLLQPGSCRTSQRHVLIETKGEVTRGMTVVDNRPVTDGLEPNTTIVTYIESDDFIERFITAMNNLTVKEEAGQ